MIFGCHEEEKTTPTSSSEESPHRKDILFKRVNTTWDDREEVSTNKSTSSPDKSNNPGTGERKYLSIPPYKRNRLGVVKMTSTQKHILKEFPPKTDYKAERLLQWRGGGCSDDDDADDDDNEYLVKWRGRSYRDSTWLPKSKLPRNMFRWQRKHENMTASLKAQGYDNPGATAALRVFGYDGQVPRVPEESLYTVGNSLSLVKWTNCSYAEATWEQTSTLRFEERSTGPLREYQQEGVKWLLEHWAAKRNCVLGDEPGIGRRVQVLVALDQMHAKIHGGMFLVVTPDSAAAEWKRVCDKWTSMRSIKLSRGRGDCNVIEDLLLGAPFCEACARSGYDVLIVPHSVFLNEYEFINATAWSCVVVEDQALRLVDSVTTSDFECVLVVAEGASGREWAGALTAAVGGRNADILERTKDIYKGLSKCPAVENVVLIEQTESQHRDIRNILDENFCGLVKGDVSACTDALIRVLRRCNYTDTKLFSEETGKMAFMYKLLYDLTADNRDARVLVLANSEDTLESLRKYFDWIELPCASTDSLCDTEKCLVHNAKVFLVNKTHANVAWIPERERELIGMAIIYESDLNPIADNLKIAEYCPLIKGKEPVKVYRFVTKGTCEHYALAVMSSKRKMSFEDMTKM